MARPSAYFFTVLLAEDFVANIFGAETTGLVVLPIGLALAFTEAFVGTGAVFFEIDFTAAWGAGTTDFLANASLALGAAAAGTIGAAAAAIALAAAEALADVSALLTRLRSCECAALYD